MEGIKYSKEDLQTLQVSITNTSTSTKTINLFDGTGLYNANNSSFPQTSNQYNADGGRIQGVYNSVDGLYYTLRDNDDDLISYDIDGNVSIVKTGVGAIKNMCISVTSQKIYFINASKDLMRFNIINGELDNFGVLSGFNNVDSIFVNENLSMVLYLSENDGQIYYLQDNTLSLINTYTTDNTPKGGLSIISNPSDTSPTSDTFVTYSDPTGLIYSYNYITPVESLISSLSNIEVQLVYYPDLNYVLFPSINKIGIIYLSSGVNIDFISGVSGTLSLAVNTDDNSVIINSSILSSYYFLSKSNLVSRNTPELINTGISDTYSFVGIVGLQQSVISNNRNNSNVTITKEGGGLIFNNPDAYNFLVWNIKNEPIKVFDIDLVTSTFNQLTKIISVNRVDANGVSFIEPYIPINDFSAYQQQTLKVSIPFVNLVLDGNTYFKDYEILSGETINFILWYIQETKNLYDESSMIVMIKNPLSKDIIKQM